LVNALVPFWGGDIKFQDVTITSYAKDKRIRNSNLMVCGFSNTFSYKSLISSYFMDFSYGNQVYNAQRACLEAFASGYDNQSTASQ